MAKLTQAQIVAKLADVAGKAIGAEISKKIVKAVLDAQAEVAYKEAKNSFIVKGIGKLMLVERGPREMVMRFGPNAGKTVKIPKKKVLKFRVAKIAKDTILK